MEEEQEGNFGGYLLLVTQLFQKGTTYGLAYILHID